MHRGKTAAIIGLVLILVASLVQKMQILSVIIFVVIIVLFSPKVLDVIRKWIDNLEELEIPRLAKIKKRPPNEAEIHKEMPEKSEKSSAIDHFRDGNRLLLLGDAGGSIEKYEKAISEDPKFSDAYLNLGAAYLTLWSETGLEDHLHRSIEASRKSLTLAPGGYRSRLNLAVALSKMIDTEEEALKYFEEADTKGQYVDPVTWGKVKLFKGNQILNLYRRPQGGTYVNRLPEAEDTVLESVRLFNMAPMSQAHEASRWIDEARIVLKSIQDERESVRVEHARS
jgi:tetratricopeptide (TPR) repeat protein